MNTRNLRFKSNRVRDIVSLFHEELDALYGRGEVECFVGMLFEAYLGWDRVRLLLGKEETIDQSDLLKFHWALEDLGRQRPIQHIIGYTDFCGCRIEVGPDVLIPRPETEEMMEWIVRQPSLLEGRQGGATRILDLCTGSGCIAIALKKAFPQAAVTAVDISGEALAVARRNAANNGTGIAFLQADLLSPQFPPPDSRYSVIVSNPPYVRDSERTRMQRNVLDYDPALALFVPDDDPLRFYRAIAQLARQSLTKDGLLVVEINESLSEETCALLRRHSFLPTLHRDFRSKPRWISAVWNP